MHLSLKNDICCTTKLLDGQLHNCIHYDLDPWSKIYDRYESSVNHL